MKILADVHGYPPGLNAGAEHYLRTVLENMVSRGHEAQVHIGFEKRIQTIGHDLSVNADKDVLTQAYRWADVVITHLDRTADVVERVKHASKSRKPLVHIVHNEAQLEYHGVGPEDSDLVVFNSNSTRRATEEWLGLSMVIHPPVIPAEYEVETDKQFVTLLNLNENKGARLFKRLAIGMPQVQFLGVLGGYEEQNAPLGLPNVTIWKNLRDVRDAYRHTSVLLVPSAYETYGRVAIEAAVSGIPIVAAPTPGLYEAMGAGAIYHPRDQAGIWSSTLRRLLQVREEYDFWSQRARKRAHSMDPIGELDRLEDALRLVAGRRKS